jgi:hypothetical protein
MGLCALLPYVAATDRANYVMHKMIRVIKRDAVFTSCRKIVIVMLFPCSDVRVSREVGYQAATGPSSFRACQDSTVKQHILCVRSRRIGL